MSRNASAQAELHAVFQLLHLAHHRNRNQHRHSTWYRSFSQLRRQIAKLTQELIDLETAVAHSSMENKYVLRASQAVDLRVQFMCERLTPKCYVAFGNLVADNQYAPLGLVMIGALSRVWRVLQELLPEIEVQDGKDAVSLCATAAEKVADSTARDNEDLGEVVSRLDAQAPSETHEQIDRTIRGGKDPKKRGSFGEEQQLKLLASSKRQKKRKKPKKGDVFDDIFSGLL